MSFRACQKWNWYDCLFFVSHGHPGGIPHVSKNYIELDTNPFISTSEKSSGPNQPCFQTPGFSSQLSSVFASFELANCRFSIGHSIGNLSHLNQRLQTNTGEQTINVHRMFLNVAALNEEIKTNMHRHVIFGDMTASLSTASCRLVLADISGFFCSDTTNRAASRNPADLGSRQQQHYKGWHNIMTISVICGVKIHMRSISII